MQLTKPSQDNMWDMTWKHVGDIVPTLTPDIIKESSPEVKDGGFAVVGEQMSPASVPSDVESEYTIVEKVDSISLGDQG